MTALATLNPVPQYFDLDGSPLSGGRLYFGQPGQNPETNPKTVYWDAASTQPAAQPIRTLNGMAARAGTPAIVFADGDYSITVKDRRGKLILYLENSASASNDQVLLDLINALTGSLPSSSDPLKGAGLLGVNQALAYAAYTVGEFIANLPFVPTAAPFGAKFDNVTDDTAALNACATAARSAGRVVQFPRKGTARVSGTIDFSGIQVIAQGRGKIHIQATSAQFDVIKITGDTTLHGLYVHGGWDGTTAGQSGDIVSIKATSPDFPYNVHLRDCVFQYGKRRHVYWERGGYSSAWNIKCNAAGLHSLELFGNSGVDACTTVMIGGFSVFSDTPNGYGVKMTECINVAFDGAIAENTKGIQTVGVTNRALAVKSFYQENTIGGKFLDWAGSSGIGIDVRNCFGGGAVIDYNANWLNPWFGANSNLTEPSVPFDNQRLMLVDGNEQTTSVPGSFTAASIVLGTGTWMLIGYVQTVNAAAGTLTQLAATFTTNNAASGLNNSTGALNFGSDEQTYNPGANADLRVKITDIVQNASGANVTYYLRTLIQRTAGSIAYRGAIKAMRIS